MDVLQWFALMGTAVGPGPEGSVAGGLPSDRYWRPERVGVANALG